jgi:Flp pilus assembly protein CpaB
VGIALVILALILDLGVLAASSKRSPVLLATHTLPAGTVLSASDLRTGQLAGEASVLAALIPGRESQQVIGQRLSSAVPAGAPVPAGVLAGSQSSSSALVLSVPEFDVIGAKLQPGNRVTVLATFGAGSGPAATRPVARNLEVLSVGELGANANPSTTTIPVTVAVENTSLASSLALANEDAKLDLLLEGSGASTAAIPSATQGSVP